MYPNIMIITMSSDIKFTNVSIYNCSEILDLNNGRVIWLNVNIEVE